ncbi:MAG: hypothetical protein ABIH24_02075 [Verrucomicrobiota bacterium]
MLNIEQSAGTMLLSDRRLVFADRGYGYALSGQLNNRLFADDTLLDYAIARRADQTVVTGRFAQSGLECTQRLCPVNGMIEETIMLRNPQPHPVRLQSVKFGFLAALPSRLNWRLIAIPFRVQLDGSVHDYSGQALVEGRFHNAVYTRLTHPEAPLTEDGIVRSEAWAWGTGAEGLVIIKYNNQAIELSVAMPMQQDREWRLRFGGAGFALYGEPSTARVLAPGAEYAFGSTYYATYTGGIPGAYRVYRDFIASRGHGFPADYNPSVNWNELYDVGWYHSDPERLKQSYTRATLLKEAAKAQACGCEALYLDPGWEVCEGATLWDEPRLGPVSEFVKTLKQDYGLDLAFRTILRCHKDMWPLKYLVRHAGREPAPIEFAPGVPGWELCLCNPEFWKEKLRRILDISKHGVRFIMFDEMDWRGPCHDPLHGHAVPGTPLDHVMAVYNLAREVRRQCPDLAIEAHDPLWPWSNCIYVPTYFQQGFGDRGAYDENWGFEYMWDCLNDLRSGRALALYYYALGCDVPLYLHITMAADNDNCVFFWWTASTVRHLGIGGKDSNRTIEPGGGLPPYDHEKRFVAYRAQMQVYRQLKPYFVRGRFIGLAENIHLHTLPGVAGGVVNVFNIDDTERQIEFTIPAALLGGTGLPVAGASAHWAPDSVMLRLTLPPMSPALIRLGVA